MLELYISTVVLSLIINTATVVIIDKKEGSKAVGVIRKVFKIIISSIIPVFNIIIPCTSLGVICANPENYKKDNNKQEDKIKRSTNTQMQNKLHFQKTELMRLKEGLLNTKEAEIDKPKQKTLSK